MSNIQDKYPKYKTNMPKYKTDTPKYEANMPKYKTNIPNYKANTLNLTLRRPWGRGVDHCGSPGPCTY